MRYIAYPLLLVAALMLATQADAITLGKVTVPLESRSSAHVKAAEKAALARLLVQLTGHKELASVPAASQLLATPDKWISSYGYNTSPNGALTLSTDFDVASLNQRLMAAGAPVWSLSRPPLLLWVVTDNGLVTASNDTQLTQAASLRGLPLVLPQAASELAGADIRGRFMQPVFAASKRYDASLIATAVIYAGNPATLRWWLYQDGQLLTQGQGKAADASAADSLLINQLTTALSSRYAVQAGQAGNYRLTVKHVDSLTSWHQLDGYLSSLAGMNAVAMRGVDANRVSWALDFAGGKAQLEHLLAVNPHLQACRGADLSVVPATEAATSRDDDAAPASPSTQMVFCWVH